MCPALLLDANFLNMNLHMLSNKDAANLLVLKKHLANKMIQLRQKHAKNPKTCKKTAPSGQVMAEVEESSSLWEYGKEFYKEHFKKWMRKDKKTTEEAANEPEEGKWAEPSEEVAIHDREILDGASWATKRLAKNAEKDPERASEFEELSQKLAKGSELVKTGAESFEKIKEGEELFEEFEKAKEALDKLNSIDDFSATPEPRDRATHAFDTIFSSVGTIRGEVPATKAPSSLTLNCSSTSMIMVVSLGMLPGH
jgi:hypothetical protein